MPIRFQSCSKLVSICFQFTLQSGSNPSIIYCRQDVNQLPILCQSGSSPVPIRHHSEANGLPGLNDSVQISINLWPIHQANPWPIGCQSLANTKLLPIPTALAPIRCQSHSNPLSTQPIPCLCRCQACAELSPIHRQSHTMATRCQSGSNLRSIHGCPSHTNPLPILLQFAIQCQLAIQCQSITNLPIYHKSANPSPTQKHKVHIDPSSNQLSDAHPRQICPTIHHSNANPPRYRQSINPMPILRKIANPGSTHQSNASPLPIHQRQRNLCNLIRESVKIEKTKSSTIPSILRQLKAHPISHHNVNPIQSSIANGHRSYRAEQNSTTGTIIQPSHTYHK